MSKRNMSYTNLTLSQKRERLDRQHRGSAIGTVSLRIAFYAFLSDQKMRGNSKATIDFYERFYRKLLAFLFTLQLTDTTCSVEIIELDRTMTGFVASLGEVSQQTVNSYLRGYRSFGRWCEAQGYIRYFRCPIKEIEPPAKQTYTNKELEKLLIKPDISRFAEHRNWVIINLLLATGARANTIINIKVGDVDMEEGYIIYNTTKAHKVVRLGLERKMMRILADYISRWRNGCPAQDHLFPNEYGEPLTRSGLSIAIRQYNLRRGVEKTSIHLFRHTFAKNWITSGGDIITLAKVLTHSELEMVKRYANLYADDVRAEMEEHSTLARMRTKSGARLTTRGCSL